MVAEQKKENNITKT